MTALARAFKAADSLASLVEDSAGVDVVFAEVQASRIEVRIADVDTDTQGLMPLAAAARAAGLTRYENQWLAGTYLYSYTGQWQGLDATVCAYGAKRVDMRPAPAADPLAVEGVAA